MCVTEISIFSASSSWERPLDLRNSFITLDEIRNTTFTGNYSITSSEILLTNINPSSFQINGTFNGPEQKIQNLYLVRNRNAVAKVGELVK